MRAVIIERGSGNVFADLGFEDAEEMLAKQSHTKETEASQRGNVMGPLDAR